VPEYRAGTCRPVTTLSPLPGHPGPSVARRGGERLQLDPRGHRQTENTTVGVRFSQSASVGWQAVAQHDSPPPAEAA